MNETNHFEHPRRIVAERDDSAGDREDVGMKSISLKASIPPISLLMALSAFRELNPGEIIEVEMTDADMAKDLILIIERSGDLRIEDIAEGDDFRIRVRKQ